jgi:hypothetical protein
MPSHKTHAAGVTSTGRKTDRGETTAQSSRGFAKATLSVAICPSIDRRARGSAMCANTRRAQYPGVRRLCQAAGASALAVAGDRRTKAKSHQPRDWD